MDYDDNDFQGQNLHLDGEGSSKFSPVLRPYALPKFDFDDSLQGHLRFDSLVENEVFLGIPSQEDNQWIEDFSRGSSGIEFSSSAAESCSISRRNNVWSEATSSESVEMLLKSVRQEEMIPGETIIEESHASDELGSLTNKMEPNPKQDDGMKDVVDSHPVLLPDESLEHFSGLNEGAGGEYPYVEGTSKTQEADPSACGSSSELDRNAGGKKCGVSLTQRDVAVDGKCDDAIQTKVSTSVNESLGDKIPRDASASGMQINNMDSSSQDIMASVVDLNNQEIQHHVSDISFKNANCLSEDIGKSVEEHPSKEMDEQNLKGHAVETGTYNLESPLCLDLKVESTEHAVETRINKFEEPSSLPLNGDGDLQIAEGCSEDICSTDYALGSSCEAVVLSKSIEINERFKGDMGEEAPLVFRGDSDFEGHDVDISNTKAGICASSEQMGSIIQITHGQSSSTEKKEDSLGSDRQLACDTSVNSEASLLSGVDNELSSVQGDGSINDHAGDHSNLNVVCSSTELLIEKCAIENLEVVNDASGIQKEESNNEFHVSHPMLGGPLQICERDLVSQQGDVRPDQEVSFNKGNLELPTETSNEDCETVGSLCKDESVKSLSLGEGTKENDMLFHGSECDTTTGNEPALDVALEKTNLVSHNTLDGVSLVSESGGTVHDVTDHSEKSPSLVVGSMQLDKKAETKVEVLTEPSLSTLKGFSDQGSVSGVEKSVSCHSAGQLLQETLDQSLPILETCNTASQSGQAVVANEVSQEGSKKLEDYPVLCDSTVKEGDEAKAVVVLENRKEDLSEEIHKVIPPSEVAEAVLVPNKGEKLTEPLPVSLVESCSDVGQKEDKVDTSHDHQGSFVVDHLSECDINHVPEGGSSADSDRPNCGSPTIISCSTLSQSEKDLQKGVKGSPGKSIPLSEVADGTADKVQLISHNLRENDATNEAGSFTFAVNPSAGLSERETSKNWESFPSIKACKISTSVEGFSSTCMGQMDPKMVPEISSRSTRVTDGVISPGGSKGTPERKSRRGSCKATGKESAKKGNHVKESTLARGNKVCSVSKSPSATGQLVQLEVLKPYGIVDHNATKPCGVVPIPGSNLPDLNSSTLSSALFQQPFTDSQQVQLRAQIFVYGSLIQGTAPDEACMISAFGISDDGRSVWEPAWRGCVDRIQGQKSRPSNLETPVQSRSGTRVSDQAIKPSTPKSKVLPSPGGRASSKGTPSPVANSGIPLSSPLWSISTPPSDGLQSSGMPRGTVLDYHQAVSALHPYQTPSTRNFVGHNTSWLSQAPFPGGWVASAQTSAFDTSARFSMLPIMEAVKLTPVRESSVSMSSATKNASPSTVVHREGSSVLSGTSSLLDMKKVSVSPGQHSAETKSRKRKKVPVSEDLSQISLLARAQTESLSAPAPAVTSHFSTSVAVTTSGFASKSNADKIVADVIATSSTDQLKRGDQNAEQKVIISEETFSKVVEAKLQAEDAATHAAAAVSHSQSVWSQLDKQKNSGLISDVEAKIGSAAVAIAAAAAVAKAAAAAAKIASSAALQAKLMADEALVSNGTGNPTQRTAFFPSDVVHNLGKATPTSILKGGDGSNFSNSVIVAAREAARRRIEAASAASKHAENLDAIVKAAELAAEAVSQAGIIVAMGNPLPLSELVVAGPEGYWKVPQITSEEGVKLKDVNKEQSDTDKIEGSSLTSKRSKEGQLDKKEIHGMPSISREISRESMEDNMRVVQGISGSVASSEKDLRGRRDRRTSELAKTIGVVPESEIGPVSISIVVQDEYEKVVGNLKENSIKEGCIVEVFKDHDNVKAAWFSAKILSLKDGKAFVCYTELQSDEGSGGLKEWVTLEVEGNVAPRIRIAHPMTITQNEGTRKRRRAAMGDYSWSVGDRVDAWIQDCWREGIVMEKNTKDETALTIRFPAEGQTSVVRAWHLRPTLIWNDGEWIEWSSFKEKDHSSLDDTRQEKRLKLGSPAALVREKGDISKSSDLVESGKPGESFLLPLSANEKFFNVGKHRRDENKPDALRAIRTGLQKEGSKVIFGVPKPGKKRKFMEVSKHYVAETSMKNNESNDSSKFEKYLMPQRSESRGWKNNSKIDSREKQAAESKPKVLKPGKPQSVFGRTMSQKDKLTSAVSAPSDSTLKDHIIKDSIRKDKNESGCQNLMGFKSLSNTEDAAEGPILFSSLALQSDAPPKKMSSSNAKSERLNKGKVAPSGGKLAKIEEDRVYNNKTGKSVPEVVEPRRSNRRIQPTSRLLEGLQSSLIISKIPAAATNDKTHKSTSRNTSRGNNHG
ncbi:uncharacterized protein LOC132287151 [Cornus florida]|uniref:uncharacterized protein LOC132287151 n=1 Tax=Cornus florida TaxID=4283 RepID=UPI0028A29258|nr:uncharacterized protein LOC132287151 [Cornus florida]XP_059645654.1 uncharacterized protein LOC132287151 [Cornus florida]